MFRGKFGACLFVETRYTESIDVTNLMADAVYRPREGAEWPGFSGLR